MMMRASGVRVDSGQRHTSYRLACHGDVRQQTDMWMRHHRDTRLEQARIRPRYDPRVRRHPARRVLGLVDVFSVTFGQSRLCTGLLRTP